MNRNSKARGPVASNSTDAVPKGDVRIHWFKLILVVALLTSPFGTASGKLYAAERLVSASYSDRYHRSSCKIVEKIHKDDLLVYSSPQEAIDEGRIPCKKCDPPLPDGYEKRSTNFNSKTSSEIEES